MTLGEYCRVVRLEKKIKQKELAAKLGISAPSISSFEKGKSSPPITTVETIFNAIGFRLIPIPKDLLT